MRRKIFRLEPVDQGEGRNSFRLPFLCRHCAHASEASPMEHGKMFCVQGLELPQYRGFCAGFTLARKTDSNERPQKALPSCVACDIMGAPNLERFHKGLSDFPRAGRTLVTAFADFTCRAIGQVFSHIGQVTTSDFPRGIGGFSRAGERCSLPFSFPVSREVFNV